MPNSIELFKVYITQLDDVYKYASTSSVLDGANNLAREGYNAGEMIIPKYDMDGLGDYDRTADNGYASGSVSLTYETKKCNYDRGRTFSIYQMDNTESAGIAFGQLASEFIRTKVAPEIDAVRYATYAGMAAHTESAALGTDGAEWLKALRKATTTMDNAEVPQNDRYLFITSDGVDAIDAEDLTKSRAVMGHFTQVITVPKPRFYSAVDMLSGKGGEAKGGFKQATTGKELNFLVVSKSAVIQYMKNVVNKVITPEENQDDDKWKFFYHPYGINETYDNKKDGIYCHTAA